MHLLDLLRTPRRKTFEILTVEKDRSLTAIVKKYRQTCNDVSNYLGRKDIVKIRNHLSNSAADK